MEIRKNSERPAEGRNKDLGCHHLQNTVGFEQTRVRAKAGLNRRCRPPSPRMAPYIEGLPRGPKDPLQALPHPATRLVPHTSRRNGLRLLRLVEGDRKGGGGPAAARARCCIGMWTHVYITRTAWGCGQLSQPRPYVSQDHLQNVLSREFCRARPKAAGD